MEYELLVTKCIEPEVEVRASNGTGDRLCGPNTQAQGSSNDRNTGQAGLIGGLSGGFALLLIALVVVGCVLLCMVHPACLLSLCLDGAILPT